MQIRYALYFTPPPGDPLGELGCTLLGYDCYTGELRPQPALPGIGGEEQHRFTEDPRLYGFHATLKAPFRLAEGSSETALRQDLLAFASQTPPVELGALVPALLGRFVALVPAAPSAALALFAAECLAAFEPHRAPLTDAERARRDPDSMPRGRAALLDRWGYPYVFEGFRFHMTLTGALPEERRALWLERLAQLSEGLSPVAIDAISLLRQDGPGHRFRVIERVPLGTSI
jgi:putative phosphonate metabolism protein